MEFTDFKQAVQSQFDEMRLMSSSMLFRTGIEKELLWNTYLDSFPPGSNKVYRERREYDCQHCKQFIRAFGDVVVIFGNKLMSVWDIEIGGDYQAVADAMSFIVKTQPVSNAFFYDQKTVGVDFNRQQLESGEVIRWNHFSVDLPKEIVKKKDQIDTILWKIRSDKEVFERGLIEISNNSCYTVLELINQNSIYRGKEHRQSVENFFDLKREYDQLPDDEKNNWCWVKSREIGVLSKIRNSVIGTLLTDISEGKELDIAVKAFETKVAPANYKRPSAVITKSMIRNAEKTVSELGLEKSLPRRFAVIDDITINNVIWADREAKKEMSVFDEMAKQVPEEGKSFSEVEEIGIEDFVKSVLPRAQRLELFFENQQEGNLFSLISPKHPDAKPIFKWNSLFSWTYKGELADSMKEIVKRAGGNVSGVLRFSIQWNEKGDNQNDFDAHCVQPGNHDRIYFESKGIRHRSSGMLDVDIIHPKPKQVAVENIVFTNLSKMPCGDYQFMVHNFTDRGGTSGFRAEIEFDEKIFHYDYPKKVRHKATIPVAVVTRSKSHGFSIVHCFEPGESSRDIWGISTQAFHRVKMVLYSPNHWDGEKTGNKHYFFILENCLNDGQPRGFFNEFLRSDLNEHRKVFEILGSKMKVEKSSEQLSGLGFSSTQKNVVVCRVSGSFSRVLKIKF